MLLQATFSVPDAAASAAPLAALFTALPTPATASLPCWATLLAPLAMLSSAPTRTAQPPSGRKAALPTFWVVMYNSPWGGTNFLHEYMDGLGLGIRKSKLYRTFLNTKAVEVI